MARSLLVLALIVAGPLTADPAPGPTPPLAPPATDASPEKSGGSRPREDRRARFRDDDASKRPESGEDGSFKRFRSRLDQLSPAERDHFKENWKRWSRMGDKEQKDWQRRAGAERDHVKKIIDEAIADTGLKLSGDQKEMFALRYFQERRKVEEALHAEFEAKRDREMIDVLSRLTTEFSSATPTPAATPAPAATP